MKRNANRTALNRIFSADQSMGASRAGGSRAGVNRAKESRNGSGGAGKKLRTATPFLSLKAVVWAFLFIGIASLLILNRESITHYFNQPIVKLRMDNKWQSLSEAEVRQVIDKFMGAGYFDFDLQSVKAELESHPWIRHAAVKKVWPDGVALQLTEENAIARWGENQLINQYAEIFQPHLPHYQPMLPVLTGPEDSHERVMKQYSEINNLFIKSGLHLTRLALSERGNWTLELNNQLEINAGRNDVKPRLTRFIEFHGQQPVASIAAMAAVDLRYDNGFAVRHNGSGVAEFANVVASGGRMNIIDVNGNPDSAHGYGAGGNER